MYRLHERLVAIRTEYNLRLKSGSAPISQVTVPVAQRPRQQELEDVTLRYLQDLLAWVEENQRRISGAEWGIDLLTVESQLGSHRGLHQSIEEFRAKIERARADEVSPTGATVWPALLAPAGGAKLHCGWSHALGGGCPLLLAQPFPAPGTHGSFLPPTRPPNRPSSLLALVVPTGIAW